MTETVLPVVGQEPNTEKTESTEREFTPMEVKAIEQGWIPKEDFDGDESEFIDAPEFVRRGELFKKIEHQSKELKAVRQALDAFRVHHTKVKESEYSRALKSLQEARRQAFVDGEHEKAFALEERIDEVKAEKEQIVQEAQSTEVQPDETYTAEFQNWVSKNSWYEDNRIMRKAADALGLELHQQGNSPAEVLRMVEKEIKREFAHKFQNPNTSRAPAVEPSTRSSGRADTFSMSADEKEIMRKIVAVTPGYTEADYIKDLKRTR